jgi:hypothetical protein
VTEPIRDRWAEWLLERRFGSGDPEQREKELVGLIPWRDRILKNAAVKQGETLLDVGAGDGLIAFGALDLVGENGQQTSLAATPTSPSRTLVGNSCSRAPEIPRSQRWRRR